MKEIILNKLEEIEKQYGVKVLLAVESGSRAWGFASTASDFDVRFIYIHCAQWYLSIDSLGTGSKRDVIENPVDKNLDISGWELTKALRLFRKSNPTILEWLRSDLVYIQNDVFVRQLRVLEKEVFNPVPILHHYFNLARGNYNKYFQGKDVKIKIILYVLKSLLACMWIEKNQSFPPIRIEDLLLNLTNEKLKQEVDQLVQLKISGEEKVSLSDHLLVHEFIDAEIEQVQKYLVAKKTEHQNVTTKLDEIFRETLASVWRENQLG